MITKHLFPGAEAEKAAMKSWIRERREIDPTSSITPSSGWSSAKNLFDSGPWSRLLSFILGRIEYPDSNYIDVVDHDARERVRVTPDWEVSAWANVMNKGQRVLFHHHERSQKGGEHYAAGVYYVDAPPGSAPIIFWPEGYTGPKITQEIEDGLLVLFYAGLCHSVPAHPIKAERISVAFNIRKVNP